ncbi:DUF1799 domain-containing protein [Tistrella bauzanensis]|uniref:DUF1799 domain-containing protein n=1 Tax=Tistrella TaxID=171436 RepID=UPI0031F6A4D0
MGVDLGDYVERALAAETTVVELWAENVPVWTLWTRCQTQWRRAGMSGAITGLDYVAVARVADILSIPLTPETLDDIAACEAVTLDIARRREETSDRG